MKLPPCYPDYHEVKPPGKLRWAIAGCLFWLLFALVTLLVWPQNRPAYTEQFWFWVMGLPWSLVALLFAVRCLIYQVALSNQKSYREIIQQAEARWWAQRALGLPIEHLCLLGPVGDKADHHLAVLRQAVLPPAPFFDGKGGALLRCPQVLENDPTRRELALMRHLARTLMDTLQRDAQAGGIEMYWFGSQESGQIFQQSLAEQGWQLPASFLTLENIADLDQVIDRFYQYPRQQNARLLCAGVHCSQPTDSGAMLGEAGFAWIAGHQGTMLLHRPERQDSVDETPMQLTAQVMKVAAMKDMPECCLAMQKSVAEEMQQGGWPTLENILDVFWGELHGIAPFVAMSIALLHSKENQQPCGWLAQDAESKRIIGVITIDKEQ